MREIFGLAKSKGILPEEYFDGARHWDEITPRQWSRIEKQVLSDVGDVGYAEDVTPKDLIAELMKPEPKTILRRLSESSRIVPDLRSQLACAAQLL